MDLSLPAVDGYGAVLGADFGGKYDYPCANSSHAGMCMLQLPIQVGGGWRPVLERRGAQRGRAEVCS